MDDFKINTNPPKVSDEQAMKHMNFDKVMASYQAMKLPFYKTLRFWLWTTGGFTALIALVILLNISFSPGEESPNHFITEIADVTEPEIKSEPIAELDTTPLVQEEKVETIEKFDTIKTTKITTEKVVEEKPIADKDSEQQAYSQKKQQIEEQIEQQIQQKKQVVEDKMLKTVKPIVTVCGKKNGEQIDKMQLGTVGKLKVEIEELREKWTVVSFDMDYQYKGRNKTLHSDSYKLSKDMLYATDDMKPGDMVKFYNITAQRPDGSLFLVGEISLIIEGGMKQW